MKITGKMVIFPIVTSILVCVSGEISTRFKSSFANCSDPKICVHEFCYIKAYSRKLATLNFSLLLLKKLVKPYFVSSM